MWLKTEDKPGDASLEHLPSTENASYPNSAPAGDPSGFGGLGNSDCCSVGWAASLPGSVQDMLSLLGSVVVDLEGVVAVKGHNFHWTLEGLRTH